MTDKLNINQWAEEDRPREKMMLHGAAALTNAELLAILIGSGNTEDTAVELMRKVLDGCRNSLSELGKCTVDDLCRYKGIGPAKAVTILAASELGKRRKEEEPARRKQIRCSTDIYDWFHPLMCDLPVEECWIMLLNQASKVIDTVRISRQRATQIALVHNHPSGSVQPSNEDRRLTQLVQQGAQTMNIRLLDHLIVTDGGYYSYADEGRL